MSGEDEEESPKRKKKGKGLSRKRVALLVIVLLIFAAGIFVQHFFVEPMFGELPEKYSRCLKQQDTLNLRFVNCANQLNDLNNLYNACVSK